MAIILVEIKTDHEDSDEAIRSVSNGMKRAGYDVLEHDLGKFFVEKQPSTRNGRYLVSSKGQAYLQAAEPEVSRD